MYNLRLQNFISTLIICGSLKTHTIHQKIFKNFKRNSNVFPIFLLIMPTYPATQSSTVHYLQISLFSPINELILRKNKIKSTIRHVQVVRRFSDLKEARECLTMKSINILRYGNGFSLINKLVNFFSLLWETKRYFKSY